MTDKDQQLIWEAYRSPLMIVGEFEQAIKTWEPAGDVRELYVDAVRDNVPVDLLDDILEKSVLSQDLTKQEVKLIKTGQQ